MVEAPPMFTALNLDIRDQQDSVFVTSQSERIV